MTRIWISVEFSSSLELPEFSHTRQHFLEGSDLPMSPRRNCMVTEIDFGSRSKEVNGALDERFGELEDLEVLNIASSKTSGDITLLSNNTKLKALAMAGTRVSGDISTMLSWKEIQLVDLSGTNVAGQPDGKWKGCCQELQDLKLGWKQVEIESCATSACTWREAQLDAEADEFGSHQMPHQRWCLWAAQIVSTLRFSRKHSSC